MSEQHTPGPWLIDEDRRPSMSWNRHIVAAANPNHAVCFMAHSDGAFPLRDEANARLIAAAPELLAALRLVLQTHDATCKGEDCPIGGIDLARAAIAKAEGRS